MPNVVTIAIAQINCVVGDLAGNAAKILEYCDRARSAGADLLLTPELALCGYPPEDLLLRDGFYRDCAEALERLAREVRGITLVVGHPHLDGGKRYNAASVIRGGAIVGTYHKHALPNYTVFDEERYFEPGDGAYVFQVGETRFGVNICEDTWGALGPLTARPDNAEVQLGINICADAWGAVAPRAAREAGAQVLLVLNASPYHMGKQTSRDEVMRERVAETGIALVYANLVGGQDELVFDGASFALDRRGEKVFQLPLFEESLGIVKLVDGEPQRSAVAAPHPLEAEVYKALCLGVRDYLDKNHFPGAIIGLSGGVDSALTLCIACDALGPARVRAVMMPSKYTAQISLEDSRELVRRLGVRYDEIPIGPAFDAFLGMLAKEFVGRPVDATEENLQARIRGTLLMALSNKFGAIVLTTGNKSEMAVGYATLYGDMAGGFAVIKDILKTLVYRLCAYRNAVARVIPDRILTRAPSAELRPNQTDQDSLPPYDVLDAIVSGYMENDLSPAEMVGRGLDAGSVRRVVEMIHRSEYKRRQAPIGIRITHRGFGKDWRYPITSRYREPYE
ncbi:MAG TPA: NAD+ synthase [Burkholderiales bacterium]|nr:NAD+ synthase [Burkholderiales bacterium]HYA46210.1 NAD+ synthase [Burkholderiales bacterium]